VIDKELIAFARDQLRALPGWEGRHYLRRCLLLWERAYGKTTADLVRNALNDAVGQSAG